MWDILTTSIMLLLPEIFTNPKKCIRENLVIFASAMIICIIIALVVTQL